MSSGNPYEPPKTPVADVAAQVVPTRPLAVTIALVILWCLLVIWALGSLGQVTALSDKITPSTWSYLAYLLAMLILPAWLFVQIGLARGWARVASIVLFGFDILLRVYMLDFRSFMDLLIGILVPATVQAIAFVLLWLPNSNAWFQVRRR
jgi:hypothetical protein